MKVAELVATVEERLAPVDVLPSIASRVYRVVAGRATGIEHAVKGEEIVVDEWRREHVGEAAEFVLHEGDDRATVQRLQIESLRERPIHQGVVEEGITKVGYPNGGICILRCEEAGLERSEG